MPHIRRVEHAKLSAAPVRVETRLEELDAPLANGLPMPLSNTYPYRNFIAVILVSE